jgi:hypothetical protein
MSSRAPALHRAGAASVAELPWQHGDLALMRGRLRLATRARSSTTIVLPAAATRVDAATPPHAPLDDGRHDNGCDIVVSRDGRAVRLAPLSADAASRAQTARAPQALPWQPHAPHASPLRTASTAASAASGSGAPKNALAGRRRGEQSSAHSSLLSWQQQQQQLLLQDAGADAPGALAAASGKARRVGGADFNYDLCCACGGGGELVCCESCPNAFHFDCTVPALDRDNLPDGDWFCRQCVAKQASKSAPPPTTSVFAAVVGAFSAVNPIEYTVPHELADLQLTLTGRSDTSRQAAATVMGADGDLLAKDRDLCVVCELPFECDNSIGPAHRFSVPSLAAGGAVAAAAAATAAAATAAAAAATGTASTAAAAPSSSSSSDAAAPPSALGLAFLAELDPYRSTDSAPRSNCGDKRKCTWCDDCYHVYCVRPASDPRLPPPPHWLCPRHFREADSNYAQQKLSKKVHALQQDPKWHRDYQAQRETQARGSAVPLLFSAVKPTSALRSAAPQPSESALGDNVRRTFVSAREQLIDADIASRPIADLRRDVERVGAQISRMTEAAFPPAMAVDVPDDAHLLANAATADMRNAALPPELEAANAAGTTATAVVAAASAVAKRSAARKRTFDAGNADANDDEDDGDARSRTAVASLLALFAADGVAANDNNDDNNNDENDEDDNDTNDNDSDNNDDGDAAVPDFEADRRALARVLLADEIEADVCERLSPTFVQFLAWQQLQLLHAKHKDGLYDLRRKEMKTSTVTNASTHAAPRSQSASRRSAVAPVGSQSTAAMMSVGGNRQLETRKKKSGLTRSACDWCYIKHYECRVSHEGASCLRCVAAGQRCSLLDRPNGELTPAPATAAAPLSSSGRQQRRRTLTDVSGPSDDSPPPPPKQTDGADESPPQQQQQAPPSPQKQQEPLQAMPFDVTEVSD